MVFIFSHNMNGFSWSESCPIPRSVLLLTASTAVYRQACFYFEETRFLRAKCLFVECLSDLAEQLDVIVADKFVAVWKLIGDVCW